MSNIEPPPPPPPPPPGQPPAPMGGGGQANGTEAIGYGWKKFGENAGPFILVSVIGFVAMAIIYAITWIILTGIFYSTEDLTFGGQKIGTYTSGPGFVGSLIMIGIFAVVIFLARSIVEMFFIRGSLLVTRGEKPEAGNMLSFDDFGQYVVAMLIVSVLTGIGFMLCYIPGIIVAFLLSFTGYFVIDKKLAPMEAVKASLNLVKDNVGPVLVFFILAWLVTLAGALLCGVGLIVAIPIVVIGTGYMYKRLQGEPVAA